MYKGDFCKGCFPDSLKYEQFLEGANGGTQLSVNY